MATQTQDIGATGRRKSAVAHVQLTPGSGKIEVNGRAFDEYFPTQALQSVVLRPFESAGAINAYDVKAKTTGGGSHGQAGAIRLAIARALLSTNTELRTPLRADGLLTRDPRMKERKKSGQPGARKRFQFSKR